MRLAFLSFVCAAAAFGQPALQLSLNRAVEIALSEEGSTKIALAQQSIVRSEPQVSQAKAALLPNIDGAFTDRSQTTNLRTFGFNFDFR